MRKHERAVVAVAVAVGVSTAVLGEPLNPPVIQDVVILGQYDNESADAYEITKSGNYLYCVGSPGLDTIEIYEDPAAPGVDSLRWKHSWRLPTDMTKMNGAAVAGDYLYVSNWDPGSGLRTFSLADPAHPANQGTRGSDHHTWQVEVLGGAVHVSEGISGPGGIRIYDITTNPAYAAAPFYKKTLSPASDPNNQVTNVTRHGQHIYWARGRWLQVYDATDPHNPVWRTRRDLASLCQYVLAHDGYLYVITKSDTYFGNNPGGLYVFRLDDPENPVNVRGSNVPSWEHSGGGDDFHIQGRYLVLPSGRWIRVLDITDPENVTRLAGLDPITLLWDDDGDGTAESPVTDPDETCLDYEGPDYHDGYSACVTGAGNYIYVGTTMDGCWDQFTDRQQFFGSRVYSIQIAEDEFEERPAEVWIDLGAEENPDDDDRLGVRHPEGGDGDTVRDLKGGRWCRRNAAPDEDNDPVDNHYFMFKVSDTFAYAGNNPEVYVGIDYFDEGTGSLTLQYDSPGATTPDKYKSGGSVTLTDTNTWKHHVFHVTDAYFGNRQNFDADFRIFGGADNTFYLDTVHVADELPTPLIELSVAAIERSTGHGVNPAPETFTVTNVGGGTLNYTASDDADWLGVSPAGGTSTDEPVPTEISYDIVDLAPGSYTATITVADPNAPNSPQEIPVAVEVLVVGDFEPKPGGDGDVDQADFGHLQACFVGSGGLPPAGCEDADIDGDSDVDIDDFALFQACIGGAGVEPGC